jgi:putative nucleotidyltransferase with HDIG domain
MVMLEANKRSVPGRGILISDILSKSDTIPAAPHLVSQVLSLTSDPNFSMDRLVSLIRMDPAITSHVLRVCNSPYYGLRNKVASLDHAVAILGVNAMVDVVLSSGLLKVLNDDLQDGYVMGKGHLWRHSVATALITQRLTRNTKIKGINPSVAFTAALLHDTGKLVLNHFVGQSFYEIESLIYEHGYSLVEAEKAVLGIDHASLGGLIMEQWIFPEEIITCVSYHHEPLSSPAQKNLVNLVALSNLLAIGAEFGKEETLIHSQLTISQLMGLVDMDPAKDDDLLRQVSEWLKPAKDMLKMFV